MTATNRVQASILCLIASVAAADVSTRSVFGYNARTMSWWCTGQSDDRTGGAACEQDFEHVPLAILTSVEAHRARRVSRLELLGDGQATTEVVLLTDCDASNGGAELMAQWDDPEPVSDDVDCSDGTDVAATSNFKVGFTVDFDYTYDGTDTACQKAVDNITALWISNATSELWDFSEDFCSSDNITGGLLSRSRARREARYASLLQLGEKSGVARGAVANAASSAASAVQAVVSTAQSAISTLRDAISGAVEMLRGVVNGEDTNNPGRDTAEACICEVSFGDYSFACIRSASCHPTSVGLANGVTAQQCGGTTSPNCGTYNTPISDVINGILNP